MDTSVTDSCGKQGPQACLKEIVGKGFGKNFPLKGSKALIGRSPNAEVPVNSCNVSRNHAFLECSKQGVWFITDNKSINGIYVNGEKLKPTVPHPLKDEAVISLGPPGLTEFKFQFCLTSKRKKSKVQSNHQLEEMRNNHQVEVSLPSCSKWGENSRRHVTRSASKRSLSQDISSTPRKKACEEEEDVSKSLQKRLATVSSLLREHDEIGKRVDRILNKRDESLSDHDYSITPESSSLISNLSDEVYDSSMEEATQAIQDASPQKMKKSKHKKKSDSDENCKNDEAAGGSSNEPPDDIESLRQRVIALEKELKEKKHEEKQLKNQLKKKGALCEEGQLVEEKEDEHMQKNIDEAKELQKKVQAGIASELEKLMEAELTCVICTELFIRATTLECAHTFCEDCLAKWRKTKKDCPICRARITSATRSLVIDGFIDKIVEKLSPEDQEKRKNIVKDRAKPLPKPKKNKRRRDRATTSTRRHATSSRQSARNYSEDEEAVLEMLPEMLQMFSGNEVVFIDSDSEGSEVGSYGYYGGYGVCYNCGRPGHWANGCPELYE